MSTIYDFSARGIDGTEQALDQYRGRVLLVVNVASKCGFTPQYAGLETNQAHRDAGLTVLGFPCDQFGHQEPGSEEEIRAFCSTKYDVSFPLHTKIEVNGANAHPLYRWLRAKPGVFGTEGIKWNFTKFLVGRDGQVIRLRAHGHAGRDREGHPAGLARRRAEIAGFSTPPCRATSAAPVGIERDGGKVHIPELGPGPVDRVHVQRDGQGLRPFRAGDREHAPTDRPPGFHR